MTKYEELCDNYENALFALLMAEVAEEDGKKYLEESEELNNDPCADVPVTLDRKCRGIIRREFAKSKRHKSMRVIRSISNKVAAVALIFLLLFTTAYALVPEVRIRTLNILVDISDVATSLTFSNDTDIITNEISNNEFFDYTIPVVPEGFIITDQGKDNRSVWLTYENDDGAVINLDITAGSTTALHVDTEDADSVSKILIHGYEGLLIEKGRKTHIVWGDTDQGAYISVVCSDVDKDAAIKFVNDIYLPQDKKE